MKFTREYSSSGRHTRVLFAHQMTVMEIFRWIRYPDHPRPEILIDENTSVGNRIRRSCPVMWQNRPPKKRKPPAGWGRGEKGRESFGYKSEWIRKEADLCGVSFLPNIHTYIIHHVRWKRSISFNCAMRKYVIRPSGLFILIFTLLRRKIYEPHVGLLT